MPLTLAQRLALARERRGFTQLDLSVRAGLDQAQVSRLERGQTTDPGFGTVAKLAFALSVTLDALAAAEDGLLLAQLSSPPTANESVALGVSALTRTPALFDRQLGDNAAHLGVFSGDRETAADAAKLELLRQRQLGAHTTVIDIDGCLRGLFDPHERLIVGGHQQLGSMLDGRIPLMSAPAGIDARDHARLLLPWLAALIGLQPGDVVRYELLERALMREQTERPPDIHHLAVALERDAGLSSGTLALTAARLASGLSELLSDHGPYGQLFGTGAMPDAPHLAWDLSAGAPHLTAWLVALITALILEQQAAQPDPHRRIIALPVTMEMTRVPLLVTMLTDAVREARKYRLGFTLIFEASADAHHRDICIALASQCKANLLLGGDWIYAADLAGPFKLSAADIESLAAASSDADGLLIIDRQRGQVNLHEGVSAAEEQALHATQPPVPDMDLQFLNFPFPGYGMTTGRAWAVYDNAGRVLLCDAPDTEGTSVVNGTESAIGALQSMLIGYEVADAWGFDGFGVYAIDLDAPHAPAGSDPWQEAAKPFVRAALAELRRRGWTQPRY